MKLGIQLHPERGIDAVFDEARRADQQGFDSIWLWDHLMNFRGSPETPDGPFDSFTLMATLAGATSRVRLGWAMLSVTFRNPAHLAKMLATLDQASHGRVIATLGAGWFKSEYLAYNLPWLEEHDDLAAYAREAVHVIKELWSNPAPARVTFEGKHVTVRDLPFSPAPYQRPHPPIWWGGDSEETLKTVKQYCDGWIPLRGADPATIARVRSAPDWPTRPITIAKNARVYVAERRDDAVADARQEWEAGLAAGSPGFPPDFDTFLAAQAVGTADDCLAKLDEWQAWGFSYGRCTFGTEAAQERAARLLLPRLAEREPLAAGD